MDGETVYRLTGDAAPLIAATKQAKAGLDSVATSAKTAAGALNGWVNQGREVAATTNVASTAADRFVARLKDQAAAAIALKEAGKQTEAQILRMAAANLGVADSAKPYIDQIEKATAKTHEFNLANATTAREGLVLFREAITGNYSRLGGSLTVMARAAGLSTLIFSGLGAVMLGVAGVAAAVAAGFIKGSIEQDKFNKSLILTGNYAGATNDSVQRLARTIADTTHATVGGSRSIVEGLIGTGEVGPALIEPLAKALAEVQHLTGESTDKMVKDWAKLGEAPLKTALEMDKAMHFMSIDLYEQMRELEELGDKQGSALLAAKALSDHYSNEHGPALTSVGRAMEFVHKQFSELKESFLDIGRETTFTDKLKEVNAQLDRIRNGPSVGGVIRGFLQTGLPGAIGALLPGDEEKLKREQEDAIRGQAGEARTAYYKSSDANVQQEAIASDQRIERLHTQEKGAERLSKQLKELARDYTNVYTAKLEKDPNAKFDYAAYDRDIKKLQDENKPKKGPAAPSDDSLLKSIELRRTDIKLQEEQIENGGKLDTFAKFRAGIEASTSKLTMAQKNAVTAALDRAAAEDKVLQAMRATKAAEDERLKIDKEIEKADIASTNSIRAYVSAQEKSIDQITKQSALLGLTAEQRERYSANLKLDEATQAEAHRIDLQMQDATKRGNFEEIEMLTEKKRQLNDEASTISGHLNQAITDSFAIQHAGYTGVSVALAKYKDEIDNVASLVESSFSKAFKGAEDSFVSFVQTGKISVKSLFSELQADVLRAGYRQYIAPSVMDYAKQGASALGLGGPTGNPQGIGEKYAASSAGELASANLRATSTMQFLANAAQSAAAALSSISGGGGFGSFFAPSGGGWADSADGGMGVSGGGGGITQANGGAWANGAQFFARGGTFTNRIVNRPTAFKFASGAGFGAGVMGEAGPEAIMPLKRGKDGSLGVAAGGRGDTHVHNYAGVAVTAKNDGPDLHLIIETAAEMGAQRGADRAYARVVNDHRSGSGPSALALRSRMGANANAGLQKRG